MRDEWTPVDGQIAFAVDRYAPKFDESSKSVQKKRRNKVRLPSNINWLEREGSNLRMAESKSV